MRLPWLTLAYAVHEGQWLFNTEAHKSIFHRYVNYFPEELLLTEWVIRHKPSAPGASSTAVGCAYLHTEGLGVTSCSPLCPQSPAQGPSYFKWERSKTEGVLITFHFYQSPWRKIRKTPLNTEKRNLIKWNTRKKGQELKLKRMLLPHTVPIWFFLIIWRIVIHTKKKFEMTGLDFFFSPKRPCFYSSVINQDIWQTFVSEHANCLENSNC